jgi:prolyl 4-hydroxylase
MKQVAFPDTLVDDLHPRWIDGFLSRRTCAHILEELEIVFWKPSTVLVRERDGYLRSGQSAHRLSETAHEEWFAPELKRALRKIEERLLGLLGCATLRYEPWQATRYRRGGKFDYHFDAGYWKKDPYGERERTVLIYLDTAEQGGGTSFKELDLKIAAQAGRLLTWNNLLPDGSRNPHMLHASIPLRRGTKTVLITWIRQKCIPRLDRRM